METKQREPPMLLDIAPLSQSANLAILNGDVDLFENKWKELFDLKRQFSWKITSENQLTKLCQEFSFKGIHSSPETNASHLWAHELAHKEEAEKLGVSSEIRLAELNEPHHSKYTIYTDISLDDLMKVTKRKASKVLRILGKIALAPEALGLGYKAETQMAKTYLASAKFFSIKGILKFT